ncbi:MAG: hypothetical protein MUE71_08145 [Chitinophagaceae bacterium]|nr:hypothetical protein [Chitinophagaceae bacterium]
MKIFYLICVWLLAPVLLLANAAAPGFRSAGGTGTFSLLYPDDSAKYRHIQMVREKVSIDIYKGYAVVKGEYWMYNHADSSFSIRVGYPLNASYSLNDNSRYETSIFFDALYSLHAFSNRVQQAIISEPVTHPTNEHDQNNWYVWNNRFEAKDTTYIEVYFIVNTNQATISKGYNKDKTNGFIYVLETGATWKQPIIQGEIRIRLLDGLDLDDIRGMAPGNVFSTFGNMMLTRFNNLTPGPDDNIILAYGERQKNLDFASVIQQKEKLFNAVHQFSMLTVDNDRLQSHTFKDPYIVQSFGGGFFTSLLMLLAIWGVPLLILLIVIFAIYSFMKRRRQSNQA